MGCGHFGANNDCLTWIIVIGVILLILYCCCDDKRC